MKRWLCMCLVLALLASCALADAAYPVTVTDQAGRSVVIEDEPRRLVSGYYISTSLLIALEQDEKLVGAENKAEKRAIYGLSAPHILDLPGVGTVKELDIELCLALEPDLVILPMRLKDTADLLQEMGVDVLVVYPESRELLAETIKLVAAATNTRDRAQALLDFTARQEARLGEALSGVEMPGVYLAGNSSMLSTAGDLMYQADMIRLAGGRNVAAEIEDAYWCEIGYEQLLAWNPDYIIMASEAAYTVEDVLNDPNLQGLNAVKNGRVCKIPNRAEAWDSPVPSGILGSVWLASMLHPDVCSAAESDALINEYYETFYGFTYSEN